jgi:hypothetical protein
MSELNNDQYISWVSLLEEQLTIQYRDSRRNHHNDDPIFGIDNITQRTSEGGFGIQGINGDLLQDTLSNYAESTNRISINWHDRTFQLTEQGKQRMRKRDPQFNFI